MTEEEKMASALAAQRTSTPTVDEVNTLCYFTLVT